MIGFASEIEFNTFRVIRVIREIRGSVFSSQNLNFSLRSSA